MEETEEVPNKIIEAASQRFSHYGYGKTTMSEIAGDCNMSTGNLYRYFDSKLDVAQAFINRVRTEQLNSLRAIARDATIPPETRLRDFQQLKLRLAYDRFHGNPRAFELAQSVLNERPEFAVEWERTEAALISEILAAANATGDYTVEDVVQMSRVVQDAGYRFTSTAVFYEGDIDPLQKELDQMIDLILDAFAYRAKSR